MYKKPLIHTAITPASFAIYIKGTNKVVKVELVKLELALINVMANEI